MVLIVPIVPMAIGIGIGTFGWEPFMWLPFPPATILAYSLLLNGPL